MIIPLNNIDGIILKTSGKYCAEDILIDPNLPLESKNITCTQNGVFNITPTEGYFGMSIVSVHVNTPVGGTETYLNAEGRGF